MATSAGDRLAAEVKKAMAPLQDARANSVPALRERQASAYAALYIAVEQYERTTQRQEET